MKVKDKKIQIRVTDAERKRIRKLARAQGVSMSDLIRQLILAKLSLS